MAATWWFWPRPSAVVESYLRDLAAWDYRGIITDTASTKGRIIGMAAEALPHPHNYVPGHPMAGSEKNGIKGARADLFKGAYWILCPDADTPAEHFARLHELVTSIGARVISLPREQHDAAVAVVSHVPHFMASSLVQLAVRHAKGQDALMRLAAGGFKDSTRIAAGSPELWCGIAFDNKDALDAGLREMQGIIGQFADALEADDRGHAHAAFGRVGRCPPRAARRVGSVHRDAFWKCVFPWKTARALLPR